MQFEVDPDVLIEHPDIAMTAKWVASVFEKYSDDKSFRKRLIDSIKGGPIKIGKTKEIVVSFFSYRVEIDGVSFETAYPSQLPSKVDSDVVEAVFDLCGRMSSNYHHPIIQVSINIHRNQVK